MLSQAKVSRRSSLCSASAAGVMMISASWLLQRRGCGEVDVRAEVLEPRWRNCAPARCPDYITTCSHLLPHPGNKNAKDAPQISTEQLMKAPLIGQVASKYLVYGNAWKSLVLRLPVLCNWKNHLFGDAPNRTTLWGFAL